MYTSIYIHTYVYMSIDIFIYISFSLILCIIVFLIICLFTCWSNVGIFCVVLIIDNIQNYELVELC